MISLKNIWSWSRISDFQFHNIAILTISYVKSLFFHCIFPVICIQHLSFPFFSQKNKKFVLNRIIVMKDHTLLIFGKICQQRIDTT
jgi:hypothetical protein